MKVDFEHSKMLVDKPLAYLSRDCKSGPSYEYLNFFLLMHLARFLTTVRQVVFFIFILVNLIDDNFARLKEARKSKATIFDSPQIRTQASPLTRPQTTVQIRPQQSTPVRVQKAQTNAMQSTKAQASSGAQLKQIVTNSSVNINNNNNNNTKSNNNNKSQVSIAVVSTNNSTSLHVVNSKMSTTSPVSKAQLTKSISISSSNNSHPSTPTTPTKSPTFNNNKTSHHEKKSQGSAFKAKDKKTLASVVAATAASGSGSAFYPSTFGDDDINDVAAMGGVNLAEESQRILGSTEFVGTQIRSCKDEVLLNLPLLQQRIRQQMARHGLDEPSSDVAVLISHAAQERLKNIIEKLAVIAEHRIDILKVTLNVNPSINLIINL